ncbi:MAG TPA: hypothetical protein ENI33_03955 [Thermoplasmatales archaeon]|nr:hypothetical protein [Thermoplasmatales archaeon]
MRVVDPNMDTALQWANELGPPPPLPSSLKDVTQRAKLVNAIDEPHFANSFFLDFQSRLSDVEKNQCLNEIANVTKIYILDVEDDKTRVNIALRLWSGCLSAAKTIAIQTVSGPNTPEMRASIFSNKIDPITQRDPIYCAGVETAPSFKKLRNEPYSFEGVPQKSVVRIYP